MGINGFLFTCCHQMVLLEKEPDAKLGISIRGGGKGSKGNPLDKNDEGIFISKVKTESSICVCDLLRERE